MSEATGTLVVRELGVTTTYAWNGNPEDKEAARRAFNDFASRTSYVAVAFDSPKAKTGSRVRTFEEIEQIEAERGVVVAQITRGLVGG